MVPGVVALHRPRTLDALVKLLAEVAPPRYLLAGGTDLLVKGKDHLIPPGTWIDIWGIPGLRGVRDRGDAIEIGALTTMSDVEREPLIARFAGALREACFIAGATAIRNRATIGGNVGNASPAGDTIPALIALDATATLLSARGSREVLVAELFTGPGKIAVAKDEVIACFRFAKRERTRGAFLRLGQRAAQAISKVSVAVTAEVVAPANGGGGGKPRLAGVRIALGAVAPTVVRAPRTEALLAEKPLDDDILSLAAEAARGECSPISDIRSTADYRRKMVGVLVTRAVRRIAGLDGEVAIRWSEARPYVGIRRRVAPGAIGAALAEILPAVAAHLREKGVAPASCPLTLYLAHHEAAGEFEIQGGFFLASPIPAEGRFETGEIAAGDEAVLLHEGPYDTLGDTHAALAASARRLGREPRGPRLELYVTDPGCHPDPRDWRTEVVLPVR